MGKDDNTPADFQEPAAVEVVVVSRPGAMSLEGLHNSVKVPHHKAGFWKQMAAYFGPGILVSVAYMDPGNWATDLAGGAAAASSIGMGALAGRLEAAASLADL